MQVDAVAPDLAAQPTLSKRDGRAMEAILSISNRPPNPNEILFLASSLLRFTLPHRRPVENTFCRRDGALTVSFLAPRDIGLPFGRWPRLILIYLTTQAVRTRSRDIQLDRSMKSFMRIFGIAATGGSNGSIRQFKEQLLKTASMSAVISNVSDEAASLLNRPLADQYTLRWDAICANQGDKQPAMIRLGERVYDEMIKSAVPLDARAIKALQQSPLALDLYCWLTYRVHGIVRTTKIPLEDFRNQFGVSYTANADFRRAFAGAISEVVRVYPRLNCQLLDTHLQLMKSETSVPSAKVAGRRSASGIVNGTARVIHA